MYSFSKNSTGQNKMHKNVSEFFFMNKNNCIASLAELKLCFSEKDNNVLF